MDYIIFNVSTVIFLLEVNKIYINYNCTLDFFLNGLYIYIYIYLCNRKFSGYTILNYDSLIWRTFVESVKNLTLGKSWDRCKAWDVIVTHPCGDNVLNFRLLRMSAFGLCNGLSSILGSSAWDTGRGLLIGTRLWTALKTEQQVSDSLKVD